MKRHFHEACILAGLFFLVGCSKNEITLQNMAEETIYFNFRAHVDTVFSEGKKTISDVPNGTYTYITTYTVPAGVTSHSAEGELSGTLTFEQSKSKVLILYSSTLIQNVYKIGASVSTTDREGGSPTAP